MTYKCYSICGPGLVRAENQDNLYVNGTYRQDVSADSVFRHETISYNNGLYAVADGMGGEKHGELASLIAVKALKDGTLSDGEMAIYVTIINDAICDLMNEKGGARIGSTFAGLRVDGSNAEILNIGDSRIYLFRGGKLTQLSIDHTETQQMIDLGLIDKAAVRKHHDRHVLTQHLGIFPSEFIIEPHTAHFDLQTGDIFLLCSDGLTDMLDDPAIEEILNNPGSVTSLAESLYNAALQNGGKDNITILLLGIEKDATESENT